MKISKKVLSLCFLAGAVAFTSCKDKNEGGDDNGNNGGGNDNGGGTVVVSDDWVSGSSNPYVVNPDEEQTPTKQQLQIEQTAMALARHYDVSEFQELIDFARDINAKYVDNEKFNTDPVADFFEGVFDEVTTQVNKNPEPDRDEDDEESWSENSYPYFREDYDEEGKYVAGSSKYVEKVNGYYIKLFRALDYSAHFVASNNGWMKEKGDFKDLWFSFTDKSGNPCMLTASTSGKEQTVYITRSNDWDYDSEKVWIEKDTVIWVRDWYEDKGYKEVEVEGYYQYVYTDSKTVNDIKVVVPEKVAISLVQNGKTLVSQDLKIDLSGLSGERIDLGKLKLGVTSNTKVCNTNIILDKFNHKNGEKSVYSVAVTKGGKNVVTVAGEYLVNINMEDKNYQYLEDAIEETFEDYEKNIKAFSGVMATVNILNEIQIRAVVDDAKKVAQLIDKAYKNDENEAKFKEYVDLLNKEISLSLYYFNSNKKQASLRFEPFEEVDTWEEYDYVNEKYILREERYWDMQPVIVFADEKSQTFEDYFTKKAFQSLIDLLEEIGDDYDEEFDKF